MHALEWGCRSANTAGRTRGRGISLNDLDSIDARVGNEPCSGGDRAWHVHAIHALLRAVSASFSPRDSTNAPTCIYSPRRRAPTESTRTVQKNSVRGRVGVVRD